ncbi:hypothetical protein LSH36_1115g00016 [Paralvinella palmiformis]|uniref:Uncharacterized protein n=1 Tax=Paralvinella palmiformis TaxID=53620 RepID=A0AAD9MQ58_9ANNE|nr:hypothetical protein LSH36_1115g00016 [Paralvinella palmiformis]
MHLLLSVSWVAEGIDLPSSSLDEPPMVKERDIDYTEVDCSEFDNMDVNVVSRDTCPRCGGGTIYFYFYCALTLEYQKCAKRCPYIACGEGCLNIPPGTPVTYRTTCTKTSGIGVHLVRYQLPEYGVLCMEFCCCEPYQGGAAQVPPVM